MHLNSDLIFKEYCLPYFKDNLRVLEIGPSGNPDDSSYFCSVVNKPDIEWNTLSLNKMENNPNHIYAESEYQYPIEDNSYDIVFSAQVMEHVKEIWTWLDELKRIVKKDGYIITISPISWTYHEAPVDCWRIYPEGMKALVESKNLKIICNKFESMEKEQIPATTPTIPGDSSIDISGYLTKKTRATFFFNKVFSTIPWVDKLKMPVTVSYDNICICQKVD